MKKIIIGFGLAALIGGVYLFSGPNYKNIDGWTSAQNKFLENYLIEMRKHDGRKVAVLDIDGTMIGQVPFYLADETMLTHARDNEDKLSRVQKDVIKYMLTADDTASDKYTRNRIAFLAGLSPKEQSDMGLAIWENKYGVKKIYSESIQLIKNLERFGFEVYGITCSPEFLYQGVVMKYFGLPSNRIIGAKGIVANGVMTDKAVEPFSCHAGKAETIQTFIKESPLIAVGNSSGDNAMVSESVGIKIWVNPNDKLAAECNVDENCIVVRSNDIKEPNIEWQSHKDGLKPNKEEPK